MSLPRINLIVAQSLNRVIGRDNQMPWHLPEDLAYFRRMTLGHTVIMGRKTWDSIGKPLPGRRNIVLTRNPAWQVSGAEASTSLDEALGRCENLAEVFIIGGAQLYAAAMQRADRLLITQIDTLVEGDAYFPEIPKTFREMTRVEGHSVNEPGLRFAWLTYER